MNFSPLVEKGKIASWVKKLANKSGAYVIREKESDWAPEVLYVGESHTGSLQKTLMRHFQRWKGPTAGSTYDRSKVGVAVVTCAAEKAIGIQNLLIIRFEPRDNTEGKPTGITWQK